MEGRREVGGVGREEVGKKGRRRGVRWVGRNKVIL